MTFLFKERSPITIIWLIMLSVAVHVHFFLQPPQVVAPLNDGLLSVLLTTYIANWDQLFITILYHTLIISQALRLNYLFNEQRMFNKPTYLTAMVYVLTTAIFSQWNNLTPALLANTIIIWLYSQIVKLYNIPNPKTLLFNIGLIIGGCILLYHATILLVLIAIFALVVVRPFNITEWLVMLMGICTPLYFLLNFLFLTDQWVYLRQNLPAFQLNLPDVNTNSIFFITITGILLILMIGVYHFQDKSRRMLIQVRKNWGVLLVMLLVMLPLPFISKNAALDSLLLWCIPVSPFMANGFLFPKKHTFPLILFWFLVVLIALNNWWPL